MIILIGKTASGKSTIAKRLQEDGFDRIITFTTRPRRSGEVNGVDYYFVSEDVFKMMIKLDMFAEYTSYNTVYGRWWYGSTIQSYKNAKMKTVAILTPDGVRNVYRRLPYLKEISSVVWVWCDDVTTICRLKLRGDNDEEAMRRIDADDKMFLTAGAITDFVASNCTAVDFNITMNQIKKVEEDLEDGVIEWESKKRSM